MTAALDFSMINSEEHNFFILFDAVTREPWKVKEIVQGNEDILAAKNSIGENVLHHLAVANNLEAVRILRGYGSEIPPYAIAEVVSLGNIDMLALLLELGGEPVISSCNSNLKIAQMSKSKKYEVRGVFRAYGYTLAQI